MQARKSVVKELPRSGIQVGGAHMRCQAASFDGIQLCSLLKSVFKHREHVIPPFVAGSSRLMRLIRAIPRKTVLHVGADVGDPGGMVWNFPLQDFE